MRGWPVRNTECGVRSLVANVVPRTTRQGNSALRIPRSALSKPCAATAALVRLAAAVAEGDVSELQERLATAQGAGVSSLWIEELLLQSMLVVGYPLALVAFGVWREIAGPTAQGGHAAEPLAHEDWQAWADRGAAACREVYGRAYHKLLLNLRALHPALERSEEHTSELQSRRDLVCRLLLEK